MKSKFSDKYLRLKKRLFEYIKFNIVGTINFLVSQCLYLLLYLVFKIDYIISYSIVSILSILASYFFNTKITFKENNYSLKKILLTFLIYFVEYLFNTTLIIILVNKFKISKAIAPFIAPIFSSIPMFFAIKCLIKKSTIFKS